MKKIGNFIAWGWLSLIVMGIAVPFVIICAMAWCIIKPIMWVTYLTGRSYV